ncbi:MAG: hypothetical protein R3A48_12500 [Polyangiales bacterium]
MTNPECDRVHDALCDDAPLPSPLDAHARRCPRCAPLLALPGALELSGVDMIEMSPALREALHEAAPVRRPSSAARAAPTALVVAASLGTAALLGSAGSRGWLAGLTLTLGAAGGFALVFWRGPDGLGSPARWRRAYPIAAALLAVATAAATGGATLALRPATYPLLSPGTAARTLGGAPHAGGGDVAATGVSALLILALSATTALLGAHKSTPNMPALTGATAGAAAALLGLSVSHHGAPLPWAMQLLMVFAATAVCARVGRETLAP